MLGDIIDALAALHFWRKPGSLSVLPSVHFPRPFSEAEVEAHGHKIGIIKEWDILGVRLDQVGSTVVSFVFRKLKANRCYFKIRGLLRDRQQSFLEVSGLSKGALCFTYVWRRRMDPRY